MSKTNRQCVLFEDLAPKPIIAAFDTDALSSDGGLSLLAALDRGIQLSSKLASKLVDPRAPGRVSHSYHELFQQRVLGIAAGYSDGNDAQQTAADPMMKMAVGREPISGADLASQPTLSRFENAVSARSVVATGREMETFVIDRLARRRRRAKVVTIDLDSTVDPAHGKQEQIFFSGYYDTWCFLPLVGSLSVDDDPQQYLFYARLRPGNSRDPRGVIPLLRRTIAAIRKKFGRVTIRVRVDAGFYRPHPWCPETGTGLSAVARPRAADIPGRRSTDSAHLSTDCDPEPATETSLFSPTPDPRPRRLSQPVAFGDSS